MKSLAAKSRTSSQPPQYWKSCLLGKVWNAARSRVLSTTGRGQMIGIAALTLTTLFVLAIFWVFHSEERVLALLGSESYVHGGAEPWHHVVALMVFGAVAMVFPLLIAMQLIRARTKAFEALSAAKFEAEQANSIKANFLAHMSHELRTPLNAMLGFGEIIRDETFGKNDPRYTEYAGHIVSSAAHLLALINDVLDLSKLDLARNKLDEQQDVSVDEVAADSIDMVRPQAGENGVTLHAEVQANTFLLRADPQKLRQILVNLLSNAVKFTPSGGTVTLSAWCEVNGPFVFQIADTGIGMAQDDIPKAFSPFQQIDNPFNRKYPGTGLGLPIVKSLVELHDGTLNLESTVGEGTTVTVCLPQDRLVEQDVTEAHPIATAAS